MPFISIITDKKNTLTKVFSLDEDGNLKKNAPGHLVDGMIESHDVDVDGLAALITTLTPNQCLCLGTVDQPGQHSIKAVKLAGPGEYTRTKDCLSFQENSWLLLDFDDSGLTIPEAVKILTEIDPRLQQTQMLGVPSSSSYIYLDEEEIIGQGNFHLYIGVKGDVERYGNTIFDRLILAGYGKTQTTRNGTIIIRTPFDKSTLSPEREIFAVAPVLKDELISKRDNHFFVQKGTTLDADSYPDLTPDQTMELRLKRIELRDQANPEAEKKRKQYRELQAERRAKANGTSKTMELAKLTATSHRYDKLGRPIVEILSSEQIFDEDGNLFPVRDLLIDSHEGMRLPDPVDPYIRGDEKKGIVGRGIATVLGQKIFSHAHGGVIHLLVWDCDDLVDWIMDPMVLIEKKRDVCQALMMGTQQMADATDDGGLNNVAEALKNSLKGVTNCRMPTDKRQVEKKLKPSGFDLEDVEDDDVVRYNSKYGVADIGGKVCIVSEKWSPDSASFEAVFYLPSSLDVLTKNHHKRVGNQVVSGYTWWQQHPERLTYESVVFAPTSELKRKPGVLRSMPQGKEYNLWQGLIYDPDKATDCTKILWHIENIWCGGNKAEFDYTLAWLAHLFKYPGSVSTTALVLQSVPGAGKSLVIEKIIVKTLGVHAISSANSDDITGRFSAHLGQNVFVFSDEMAYSAEASMKSILKRLLTDEFRMIESKGINKIKARNYSSAIFASNSDWLLSIDSGDRRFVYLSVSSKKKGDTEYFKELVEEIDNGGREAFVEFLLNYDISGVDLTKLPAANQRQRRADFLRSAHPAVRMVWGLADINIPPTIFAANALYGRIQKWKEGGETMTLDFAQFFDIYREFSDYYKTDRKYDDTTSLILQLEGGGLLRRETETGGDFPIERVKVDGKTKLRFKVIEEFRELLKV